MALLVRRAALSCMTALPSALTLSLRRAALALLRRALLRRAALARLQVAALSCAQTVSMRRARMQGAALSSALAFKRRAVVSRLRDAALGRCRLRLQRGVVRRAVILLRAA